MYEVILISKRGHEWDFVMNDYATAWNTFDYYASQKELFGLEEVYFINHEYYDDSVVA